MLDRVKIGDALLFKGFGVYFTKNVLLKTLYQFSLLKNLSIMSSVRSNLFVARYDAITDISSVRSDLFAYQSYTGRSYGANRILTITCYKQYALNRA